MTVRVSGIRLRDFLTMAERLKERESMRRRSPESRKSSRSSSVASTRLVTLSPVYVYPVTVPLNLIIRRVGIANSGFAAVWECGVRRGWGWGCGDGSRLGRRWVRGWMMGGERGGGVRGFNNIDIRAKRASQRNSNCGASGFTNFAEKIAMGWRNKRKKRNRGWLMIGRNTFSQIGWNPTKKKVKFATPSIRTLELCPKKEIII